MVLSAVPDSSRLGIVLAPHFANPWVLFLTYTAVAVLPSVAWRVRTWLLSCLVLACAVVCGLPHILFGWALSPAERIIPDLFGIAAGVLLGLNLRMFVHPIRPVSSGKEKKEPSVIISRGAPPESRAPLALHDAIRKEQP